MANRYHFNKETGRANICRAEKQCPLGADTPHFDNKQDAKNYVEAEAAENNEQFSTVSKSVKSNESQDANGALAKRLRGERPVNIDMELSQLYNQHTKLARDISKANANIDYYKDRISKGGSFPPGKFESYVEELEVNKRQLVAEAGKIEDQMNVYNNEFDRRGGWNRAFIVNNINGHVHSSMNCSTCYADTEYNWVPEMSDKGEGEIVEAAGKKACTVCYPSAPVEVLSRPSTIMSDAERDQDAERQRRDAARKEKEKKADAAGITTPDGKPLVYREADSNYSTTYKTERSAQIEAVDAMFDKLSYDVMQRNDTQNYWTDEMIARNKASRDDKISLIVEAIAAKRGVDEDAVYKEFEDKAQKKIRKWMKENNLQ